MVKLQNLVFPDVKICAEEALYFHRQGTAQTTFTDNALHFASDAALAFDGYCNLFSVGKWLKYTKVHAVSLHLTLKGNFQVQFLHNWDRDDALHTEPLASFEVNAAERQTIVLPLPPLTEDFSGVLSFSITATGTAGMLYGGFYAAPEISEPPERVKLGIVICTYRREAYVQKNLAAMQEAFFTEGAELTDCVEIVVCDNASTLPPELANEQVHLFPNRNTGGAGGFTRGLIELHNANPEAGFTHALFMDDDVVVDPESVFRTHRLLALRKPQYADAFVGGAMLRLDTQTIQVESGALWNAGCLLSRKADYDLADPLACVQNETEEPVDYNAWWYCAFPLTVAHRENLPLPLFIRGDDVEYGLRNMKQLILLNGVCVWHEPFERKYASSMFYYVQRNRLIGNAVRGVPYGKCRAYREFAHAFLRETLLFRYRNADLLLRGAQDFLRGTDWLKAQDGERLHREIMGSGYRMTPLAELSVTRTEYDDHLLERHRKPILRLVQLITCNGYLLPAKRRVTVPTYAAKPIHFFRAKAALNLDSDGQTGFLTTKSMREILRCACNLFKMGVAFLTSYDSAVKDYHTNAHELTSSAFWIAYLQQKGNE